MVSTTYSAHLFGQTTATGLSEMLDAQVGICSLLRYKNTRGGTTKCRNQEMSY